MKPFTVFARMTPLKNGFLKAQCGYRPCSAPLGEAWPPQERGLRAMDLWGPGPPKGADPHRDWILHAPRDSAVKPKITAAFGFAMRTDEDGDVIYSVIRPKPKRDALGRVALDAQKQPIQRQGGSRPSPMPWATEAEVDLGVAGHLVYGHAAPLPAYVQCWRCKRLNLVPDPGADSD